MGSTLALLGLVLGFSLQPDDRVTGAQAMMQIAEIESAYLHGIPANGAIPHGDEMATKALQKANELLKDVDVAKLPNEEALDWVFVLDTAKRYKDSASVLDRLIASNPEPATWFRAKLARAREYYCLKEFQGDFDTLVELRPVTVNQANYFSGEVAMLARSLFEAQGLQLLDRVTPNLKGFDNAIQRLEASRNIIVMGPLRAKMLGKPAPSLTALPERHGQFTNLADLKGKVVILEFLATWCGPCITILPFFDKLEKEFGDRIEVVGVSGFYGVDRKGVKVDRKGEFDDMTKFMGEHKMTHPVIYIDEADFKKYGVATIPVVTVIGKDGLVKQIFADIGGGSYATVRTAIESAVK